MKKFLLSLMIFTLTACTASANTSLFDSKLSYGDDLIASFGDSKVTYADLYETLLSGYGANQIINKALMRIADIEITDQDAINKEVDELMKLYNSATSDNLLSYIQTLGYESIDEYKEDAVVPNAKQSLLLQKYVDANYETLVKEYNFIYLKQITTATESEALQAVKRINDGETFDEVAKDLMGSATYDLGLVNSASSSIDTNIKNLMKNLVHEGLYPNAVALSNGKYAVIYVGLTTEENTEEIKDSLTTISAVGSAMEIYYLDLYKFDVYEDSLAEQIKAMGDYLK